MSRENTREEIFSKAKSQTIGVLGTVVEASNIIRQRLMYFGLDQSFRCFLMSTKTSPKMDQIKEGGEISFFIFGIEEPYDDSWELELTGDAEILADEEDVEIALKELIDRNPFADVTVASGISDQFGFVCLTPRLIRFSIYGEALKGVEPTIIKFTE